MVMEIIPITLETILRSLRKRASRKRTPVIIEARIAITPQEELLLDVRPTRPLKVIRY
jgi:hypothetical protein